MSEMALKYTVLSIYYFLLILTFIEKFESIISDPEFILNYSVIFIFEQNMKFIFAFLNCN